MNEISDSHEGRCDDPLMLTQDVTIGQVYHLGGQWRAAIKIDDDLVLVARSRGEGFYLACDRRLASSFTPDPILADEIRNIRTRRRPRRPTMSR